MTKYRQKGSVLGFVLIGVLLSAMLVGGILLVRRNLTKVDTTPQTAKNAPEVTKNDNSSAGNNDKLDSGLKQALEQQAAAEKKAQEQKAAAEAETTAQAAVTETAPTPTETSNLPHTGPADTALVTAGAVLLVGVFIAYVRSRSLI